jgi:acetamidase/formamidase
LAIKPNYCKETTMDLPLRRTSAFLLGLVAVTTVAQAAIYHLPSTPQTVHRGVISPDIAPVLTIKSGDTVTIDTVSHSGLSEGGPVAYFGKASIPPSAVLQDAIDIAKMPAKDYGLGGRAGFGGGRGGGGHVLTGPIYIDGAEPGDMLEIRIKKVTPRVAYGANGAGAGGAAPGMMKGNGGKIIKYDIARKIVNFSDDVHFPTRPFMGIMAVAPTQKISSRAPGLYGGNMDFEKLQAGSTLYLPVLVKGALFVTGDSHASQGDGEVSGNALEASMAPTLEFIVHKGAAKTMTMPFAEDKANYYILGMDHDLGKALTNSIKETVKFLGERYGLSPQDAYSLCSTGIDFGIAQAVDLNLTVYGKIPKSYFKKKTPYWKS